ncbi:TonB-dependent receptor [Sphingobium sp. SCG-1]|uniref:TonB-dependent receptor n=1 Tax=Sphingobium sp. SCG-1 TaxID=2072936 RepID=UPI00166F9524|nr:TonB-dependent receptor [Sphingobium sp. SCG-1]
MRKYLLKSVGIDRTAGRGAHTALAVIMCSIAVVTGAQDAFAQQPAEAPAQQADVDDIVVTAQKRAENVQDVPISIMAFGGEQLKQSGVKELSDIARVVPGLSFNRGGQIANVRLNIRGVGAQTGTSVEPSVATFIDDVYIPRPGSVIGHFFDVGSIEVLRGPQGTLFGRNASVGALNIHSNQPTDNLEGEVALQGGSFDTYEATGVLNVPVKEGFSLRAAGLLSTTDGFARSTITGPFGKLRTYAGRLMAKIEPVDNLTWLLRGDYTRNTGDGAIPVEVKPDTVTAAGAANFARVLGGVVPDLTNPFDHVVNQVGGGALTSRQYGLTSDLSFDFGDGFTARLINSNRNWWQVQDERDVVLTPRELAGRRSTFDSNSWTHELQLISPKDKLLDGRLDFVAGIYLLHEDLRLDETYVFGADWCSYAVAAARPALVASCRAAPGDPGTYFDFHQTTKSIAGYAQATLAVTDTLDLTLGGRYTRDRKTGTFVQLVQNPSGVLLRAAENSNLRFSDGRFTYKVNLSYKPTDDVLIFANYSTGFKSGGFNSAGSSVILNQTRIFNSETVKNMELGTKLTLANGIATLNATAYRMDIDDFQDRAFDGVGYRVFNAASLRQQGVELEATVRPTNGLRLNGSVAYLDSAFLSYPNASGLPGFGGTQDLKGKPNNYSPKWQGSVGIQYDSAIGDSAYALTARTDMSFVSDSNVGAVTDNNPQSIQKGYQLVGARVTLHGPNDRWSLALFGDNLFDKNYFSYIYSQGLDSVFGVRDRTTGGTLMRGVVGMPRTLGLRFEYRY